MKRLYFLVIIVLNMFPPLSGQEFDLTFTNTETGTITHTARNSVTLGPNYTYTPTGGSLTINIQNPIVTGTVTYTGTPVDPETRSLSTSYYVGTTNGSFNVNPMGGSSYSIPLELLPGINGLSPSLSLVYSSNNGPGIAGYGWQISGLSSITRGPKTVFYDGIARGVELDTADRFYLDGQRLVNTTTYTYGNANAKYQTDNDIFTRVSPQSTDANGPGWLKAETKSGLIFEYGNSTDSKLKINGYAQIVNWYASKISDLFGNNINITYLPDNYKLYPAEITYGYLNNNKITFYYKQKTDHNLVYLKGSKIEQWIILDKITIAYNNNIVKTYEFKYNYSGSSYNSQSILNEIIEYGIGTSRFNSTAITYKTPGNVVFGTPVSNSTHGYITYNSKLCTGDFNGDGRADFLCIPDPSKGASWTGIRVYYGDGSDNFSTYFSVTPTPAPAVGDDCRALDINGDGKDDFLFEKTSAGTSSFYYMLNNGTSLDAPVLIQSQSWNAGTGFSGKIRRNELQENDNEKSGNDYNGDGVNDIFISDPSGNWSIKSFINSSGQKTSTLNTLGSGTNSNLAGEILSADFNGDGKSDIWCFTSSNLYIYSFTGTALNSSYSSTLCTKTNFFSLGDFNADGKTDIFMYGSGKNGSELDFTNWKVQLSMGTDFETYYIAQKKANLKDDYVRLGDFNADGATDLMVTSVDQSWTGTKYYISSNNGTGLYEHSITGSSAFQNYYLADYNGDGQTDYVCTDSQPTPWWNGYTISKPNANTSFLMEKVGNGLGNVTKLIYTRLSQAATTVYQKGSGAVYPVRDYQGPLSVVSSVLYDNGKGSYNTMNYYYEAVKLHLQGRGFLGFMKTRATDLATGIDKENISSYNTTYFYPYILRTLTKRMGTTDTLETVKNYWNHLVLDAARKRIFPYIQSSTQTNKALGHSVVVTCGYDSYGNPNSIVKNYSNGPTETITTTFENNVTPKWLLGRPTAISIQYTGGGNTITRSGSRVFDTSNNNMTSETWFSGTANQKADTYFYTPKGLLKCKTTTANGVSRSERYLYYSDSIRVSSRSGPTNLNFVAYTYDTYGRIYTKRDFTDFFVTFTYDDFGRSTRANSNTGIDGTVVYSWESPTADPKPARYSVTKTGTDGSQTKSWMDKLGREIRHDEKGFDGTMIYTVSKYNLKGQIDSISDPYYSTSTAYWNRYFYDKIGRDSVLLKSSGRNTTWQYSGNIITETTNGKINTKTYSSDGTISSATDNGGTINYTYYPDRQVKTITAPGNITTSMQYDVAGNQTQLTDPSAGTNTYTYDGFRQLTSQQNARSQTTQLTYYSDGRLNQKIQSVEGTTTYLYNLNAQITSILNLATNIKKRFVYDRFGRDSIMVDSIPGTTKFTTKYSFDSYGRLNTVTHPSGIVETKYFNQRGYLNSVSAGGATRWRVTGMNAFQQITGGTFGSSLNTTIGYDNFGFINSQSTGTIQDYSYNFNPESGNLNWRQNNKISNLKENFYYDNLDRLDNVYMGTTMTLDMAYDNNKGAITTKTDVGSMQYATSGKPYAISTINPATPVTPSYAQTITYTLFDKISTISENNNNATFTYGIDNERAKMVVQQGGNHLETRWYPGPTVMKDSVSGTVKTYTYIGGDAYTAPCVAIKQGTTAPKYYYLIRDHLGSITHVCDTLNNKLFEYSYDSWGRMRDPATWIIYPLGQDTSLLAGRGFTGHEHLPWFNLINMNGRAYDPLIGQFVSPDNITQSPFFTQNYNRYQYCLNNPLIFNDPSGYKVDVCKVDGTRRQSRLWFWWKNLFNQNQSDVYEEGGIGGGGSTAIYSQYYGLLGSIGNGSTDISYSGSWDRSHGTLASSQGIDNSIDNITLESDNVYVAPTEYIPILFSDERIALTTLVNSCFTGNDPNGLWNSEMLAFITNKGIVLLPGSGAGWSNTVKHCEQTYITGQNEKIIVGNFIKVDGRFLTILASIHVHPGCAQLVAVGFIERKFCNENIPGPSWDDAQTLSPLGPYFVIDLGTRTIWKGKTSNFNEAKELRDKDDIRIYYREFMNKLKISKFLND